MVSLRKGYICEAIVIFATLFGCASAATATTPVIGIVVEPPIAGSVCESLAAGLTVHSGQNTPTVPPGMKGCVFAMYTKWLEAAGVQVVPIPWDAPQATLEWYLERVNGVFLPGGGLDSDVVVEKQYFATVKFIFDYVWEANTVRKDPLLLWGTCQGFEMVTSAAAGTLSILGNFTAMNALMMKVNLTQYGAQKSTMLANAPAFIIEDLTQYNTTLNWHHLAVPPKAFDRYPTLSEKLHIVATTNDPTGVPFVAAVEGVGANIFANQFHPERPPFEWSPSSIGHDMRSIQVSQYLSYVLSRQARLNNHSFDSDDQVQSLVIENYKFVNFGYGEVVYFL